MGGAITWSRWCLKSGLYVEGRGGLKAYRQKDHLGSKCKNKDLIEAVIRVDSLLILPNFLISSRANSLIHKVKNLAG